MQDRPIEKPHTFHLADKKHKQGEKEKSIEEKKFALVANIFVVTGI